MDLYADNILDHYRHPRGKRDLASPTVTHREANASCGDALTIHVMIQDDRVTDLAWSGDGCAISQAAMSMLGEEIMGKSIDDILVLPRSAIEAMIGVPVGPRRIKCALLGLHALKNTLRAAKGVPVEGWRELLG